MIAGKYWIVQGLSFPALATPCLLPPLSTRLAVLHSVIPFWNTHLRANFPRAPIQRGMGRSARVRGPDEVVRAGSSKPPCCPRSNPFLSACKAS
ncbi:uncharacterized protein EI97DRAFT_429266 [Westerdykella ornata]|uniref:Secreted protein n=1 Tax=Westerdykella ornata TaxID=318751 RepID=A0A6A6K1G2_WESOR|nr:uncharacterized protein EI97DRAFT_429266 [Westerdykella ornata]KAF2281209.1 hypothetical protein EI97DRAFT_429266 [Westerdykella ornata]